MNLKDNYKFMGSDLRKIREAKGITRKEISEEMNTSEETIRRIEKGENDPRLSTIVPICNYLGVELSEVINNSGFEYHNLQALRKEINYLLNNSSLDEATDLINNMDGIKTKPDLNFEKEFAATKHYFNGLLYLKKNQFATYSIIELQRSFTCLDARFKVNSFKNYKYDEFSLRILLALALAEQKNGNTELYRDIMDEIRSNLNSGSEDYFLYCYNIATYYYRMGDPEKSLKLCNEAILNARKVNRAPYLNMIYYLKGFNHIYFRQMEEARMCFNYSITLTNIFSEKIMADKLSQQIDDLLLKNN